MQEQKGFNPDELLMHKFRLASVGIDKYFNRKSEENDEIPRGQRGLMGYLMHHLDQEVYQKDLEQAFHITGATASNMLKSLEKSGMIIRVPSEQDARLKRILVTELAYEREARIREEVRFLEQTILKDFSEEEQKQIFDMLTRIVHNIWSLTEDDRSPF